MKTSWPALDLTEPTGTDSVAKPPFAPAGQHGRRSDTVCSCRLKRVPGGLEPWGKPLDGKGIALLDFREGAGLFTGDR